MQIFPPYALNFPFHSISQTDRAIVSTESTDGGICPLLHRAPRASPGAGRGLQPSPGATIHLFQRGSGTGPSAFTLWWRVRLLTSSDPTDFVRTPSINLAAAIRPSREHEVLYEMDACGTLLARALRKLGNEREKYVFMVIPGISHKASGKWEVVHSSARWEVREERCHPMHADFTWPSRYTHDCWRVNSFCPREMDENLKRNGVSPCLVRCVSAKLPESTSTSM
jgi:hypothetical protein